MSDLKKQIVAGMDVSGVEAGAAKGKRALADLGAAAKTEGKKAADGVAEIPKGSDQAAAKIDAATKNMIGSIQRTTAALEAGGRSGSKYFETLASQRGIDPTALKPYLAQLDAVNAKQAAAKTALEATAPALASVGMSARATAAAMRGVPAQFTDIATSLQGGQAPLTVFLQQGGQLKDMFGGIVPAARALGTYIAGLVTPFTLAAAGIGALAVAMYQGSKESDAYAKALILTGNYLGKTTDQLKEQAVQIARTTGTQGDAAEALAKIAQSGKIASDAMTEVGAAVVSMNRVLGTSVDEATAVFAKLRKTSHAMSGLSSSHRTAPFVMRSISGQCSAGTRRRGSFHWLTAVLFTPRADASAVWEPKSFAARSTGCSILSPENKDAQV